MGTRNKKQEFVVERQKSKYFRERTFVVLDFEGTVYSKPKPKPQKIGRIKIFDMQDAILEACRGTVDHQKLQ